MDNKIHSIQYWDTTELTALADLPNPPQNTEKHSPKTCQINWDRLKFDYTQVLHASLILFPSYGPLPGVWEHGNMRIRH